MHIVTEISNTIKNGDFKTLKLKIGEVLIPVAIEKITIEKQKGTSIIKVVGVEHKAKGIKTRYTSKFNLSKLAGYTDEGHSLFLAVPPYSTGSQSVQLTHIVLLKEALK
jgi:hypothetical protein